MNASAAGWREKMNAGAAGWREKMNAGAAEDICIFAIHM